MAQKFVGLDEAAKQLGVSKDRLSNLREAGQVRAYRDGTSWKFRTDDIEKLATDGLPAADSGGSDLSLVDEASLETESPPSASSSELDLDLGGDDRVAGETASDIDLDDLDEPTVPVETAGEDESVELAADDDVDDLSDSILLSETELGESTDRPPSTIIGKAEMAADLDLELSSDSDAARASDVKLAAPASNVFSTASPSDQVLDTEPPSMSDNFSGMEELEIDLEAESSRILSPEDVAPAKRASQAKSTETSDLELAASDSDAGGPATSGGALDSGLDEISGGLTGISALELDGDEDDVLGEGSDITLSGESSGINIISPSDSGLDLGDVSLDLTGSSPIGSSIDLGSIAGDDVELEPLEVAPEKAEAAKGEEPFTLTPFEEAADEEEDSSQIIPLDEVTEEDAAGALLGVGAAESLGDEFAAAGIPGGAMAAAEPVDETPFPGWVMVVLSVCLMGLTVCGMMMYDLVRNIWSWDQPYSINSSLLEVVNVFLS
jgi:excisionase family DNA binding protein